MTANRKTRAPSIPDALRDIPSPLARHGEDGAIWLPAPALAQRLRDGGLDPIDHADALAACRATWTDYHRALKAAMLADLDRRHAARSPGERLDAMPTAPSASIGHAVALGDADLDAVRTHYHRALLAAYIASAADDEQGERGRSLYRRLRADEAFARVLKRKTRGAITADLCPDLPRRLDLTDAADEAVEDLERGRIGYAALCRRLDRAASPAVREALDDMGWNYGRGD